MTQFTQVKDSGARQEFGTGSVRDTREGKGRYDLIPAYPHKRLAVHYENGAKKYGDRNWEKGQPLMRYIDSAIRHLENLKAGLTDEDHASAAVWNIYGYEHTEHEIEEGRLPVALDDRPQPRQGVIVAVPPEPGPCFASVWTSAWCGLHPDGVAFDHTDSAARYFEEGKLFIDGYEPPSDEPELVPCAWSARYEEECFGHSDGVESSHPDSYLRLLEDEQKANLFS